LHLAFPSSSLCCLRTNFCSTAAWPEPHSQVLTQKERWNAGFERCTQVRCW
jgi:hypothetical protein